MVFMTRLALPVLPPEILDEILFILDPLDVASFAQTCKKYYNFVYRSEDNHLWRGLYLAQPLDDPRCSLTPCLHRIPPKDIDWKASLQAFIRARTVLADPSKCRPGERETIFRTLIKVLRGANPASSFYEETRSENLVWLDTVLRNGVFLTGELPGSTETELQLRAYLLVHLGLTPNDATSASKASARAFVYDMRNYHYDNDFGPYMSDGSGRVNWVHVYAIHRTIAMHLVDLQEDELFACPIPISMPYCQSIIPSGLDLPKERDWAGIEGSWHCAFSFVDHRELLRKRFPPSETNRPNPRRIEYLRGGCYRESTGSLYLLIWPTQRSSDLAPLNATAFQEPEFRDVFRVFPVRLRVIGTERDPKHVTRPRLVFVGDVWDGQRMMGRVEMTPDEHLSWKWVRLCSILDRYRSL
jgi:hypothetical protein